MIFVRRKTIKAVLFAVSILLFTALMSALVTAAEDFFYSSRLPDPGDMPYEWLYPVAPSFSVPEEGCALFIDLDTCTMTVYMDGLFYKTYPVSGGKPSSPSPVGTWMVVGVSNWGEGFGGSWIALNVPWGKYGIHGTLKPWLVGSNNVSKGCIRMKNRDVNELKRLVSWGSVVHIKHDSLPFRVLKNGHFGSDVLSVEQMLAKLGFYDGQMDGKFGNRLEEAVRGFQKDNKMKTDGVVGRRTYARLCELTGRAAAYRNA